MGLSWSRGELLLVTLEALMVLYSVVLPECRTARVSHTRGYKQMSRLLAVPQRSDLVSWGPLVQHAALFGAMIASTDAVAVSAILKSGVPPS